MHAAIYHVAIRPSHFPGYGEHPYDRTPLDQMIAGLIVMISFGALMVTLSHALIMLAVGEPLHGGFGPPPSLQITLAI